MFRPFGNTGVVLGESLFNILGHADVEFSIGILNHVDAIHWIRAEKVFLRRSSKPQEKLRG